MTESSVRIGGHITLLFSIHSNSLLARNQGSRGAGLCLTDGVEAKAKIIDGQDRITVSSMDGSLFEQGEELYRELLKEFRGVFKVNSPVNLEVSTELPLSQGFGMSAAGLLAAAYALAELFDVGDSGQVARLAHRIERANSSGLGDVLGIWAGGVELRINPGAPPIPGKAKGFSANVPALLVWVPEAGKHTSCYIDDEDWKIAITTAGDKSVDHLMKMAWNRQVWPKLLEEADRFVIDSGLMNEGGRASLLSTVLDYVDSDMSCHLCMLGTSLIIVPKSLDEELDFDEVASNLRKLGLGVRLTHLA